jgi:hypothetical protein
MTSGLGGAVARADWREEFEGSEISWREAGGDAPHRIQSQVRLTQGAHGGRSCEHIRFSAANGATIYLRHESPVARLIAESQASVWIKSDRPGLQLFARVVLPRSRDPRSGGPLSTLLAGSGYTQVGNWQQLRVENLPQLMERQTRLLRTQYGPTVDSREAYIDQIVLNVYGGAGMTNVWIDDLEILGATGSAAVALSNDSFSLNQTQASTQAQSANTTRPASLERSGAQAIGAAAPSGANRGVDVGAANGPDIRLRGALLTIDGKPFFPRVIEYRGEPLERLKSLRFNAIRLSQAPQLDLLAEAARLGMWIVAPPPLPVIETPLNGQAVSIGPEYDPVLVWDLGAGWAAPDMERVRQWIKSLRAADPRKRPIAGGPETELREFSRLLDILLAERSVIGTTLEFTAYGQWLSDRQLLARPGTPLWANVQTQLLARAQEQANLLAGRAVAIDRVQQEQVRQVVFLALAAGARGLTFQSSTPLDADDSATKRRAELLELLNIELDLIEPWAASGAFVTTAGATDGNTQAAVIQTERGRLLLPLRVAPQSQLAIGASQRPNTAYVVPGVPEANEAWELNPTGMRPLIHKRVAGGLSVSLGAGQAGSLVVLSQDALIIDYLSRRAAELAPRGAELERDLVQGQLKFAQSLDQRLTSIGHGLPKLRFSLEAAEAALREAEAAAGPQSAQVSFTASRRAGENLQHIERAYWERGAALTPNWLATPLAANVATIPEQWMLGNQLPSRRVEPNLLPGGDCENLPAMIQAGWRHYQHTTASKTDPSAGIQADVEWTPKLPHGGRASLRLWARPVEKKAGPAWVLETAPVWLTTPPIPLRAGSLAWIHGWVKLKAPPIGGVDGFLVVDSIGGEGLAERIGPTPGWKIADRQRQGLKPLPTMPNKKDEDPLDDWKEFSIYRVAPQDAPLSVTFALCGLGEVWLDDVVIQLVERGSALPPPPAATATPDWLAPRR